MTDKHELDINEEVLDAEIIEESVDETTDGIVEETVEELQEKIEEVKEDTKEVSEETGESVEHHEESAEQSEENVENVSAELDSPVTEKSAKEEIISEFAPAPIKIPNYNKEKEKKKAQKAKAKKKKAKSKKARRRRRIIRKILIVVRNIFLFAFILVVATVTLSSLLVKMNTTETSIERSIRDAGPETFTVGKINNPDELGLVQSSPYASVADIIRDNYENVITYKSIENAVDSSAYPRFVSQTTTDVINYYVYGKTYTPVTEAKIREMLNDSAGYINTEKNVAFGDTQRIAIAKRIANSPAIKELSVENLDKQEAAKYTSVTSVLFSSKVLIFLVVALLVLLVITIIYCRTYWHKIIGTTIILAGLIVGVLGFLFNPAFVSASPFTKSVLEAITKSFNESALIYGAVTVLVGALVLFIGKSMRDDDDDYYYEEEEEQPVQ